MLFGCFEKGSKNHTVRNLTEKRLSLTSKPQKTQYCENQILIQFKQK